MVVGDAAVDDGDDDVRAARLRVPGLGRVDVVVAGVVQAPELVEVGVVRGAEDVVEVVRLGEGHARVALERRHGGAHGGAVAEADERQTLLAERAHHVRVAGRESARPARHGGAAAELDDDLALNELGVGEDAVGAAMKLVVTRERPGSRDPSTRHEQEDDYEEGQPQTHRPHIDTILDLPRAKGKRAEASPPVRGGRSRCGRPGPSRWRARHAPGPRAPRSGRSPGRGRDPGSRS